MTKHMTHSVLILALLLIVLGDPSLHAQKKNSQDFDPKLITYIEGNMPLLITVSHGGSKKLGNVPERTGKGKEKFHKLKDSYTMEFTLSLVKALEKKKFKPHVLIAQVHRKYVDLNRDEINGTEHPLAKKYHQSFHRQLTLLSQGIQKKHGHVFLLDIHGQAKFPDRLMRGTKQGQLIQPLLKQKGWKAIHDTTGIMGGLKALKYKTDPQTPKGKEVYSGGFIVTSQAGKRHPKVNAFQLEIGSKYRMNQKLRDQLANDFANVLHQFWITWMPKKKRK